MFKVPAMSRLLLLISSLTVCVGCWSEPAYHGKTAVEWGDQLTGPGTTASHAQAARALARLGQSGLPVLTGALESTDPDIRHQAALGILRMGTSAYTAAPTMAEALKDPDRNVRGIMAMALGRLGPLAKPQMPALVKAQDDPDPAVSLRAREAVARINWMKEFAP